jgi:HAD superfamily hydrolase (TIGR01509 family)
MDGVIIDSEPLYRKVQEEMCENLRLPPFKEEGNRFVGAPDKTIWAHMRKKHGLEHTVEELVDMQRYRYMNYLLSRKNEKAIPGTIELIEDLYQNKTKLAVASSASNEIVSAVLNILNLQRFFPVRVTIDDVKNGKPFPDLFLYAARAMNTTPEKCIVIEDSENGIKAAGSAGMKCIGFNNRNSSGQDLSCANMTVNSLSDLSYEALCSFWNI